MKFSELKQAMDWRRRVGFNGGGYVKKKVLPQPKPKEEAEKVNKARKEKTFEKAKGALENPKEVKEMIDKPKRGLVDEPGKYSQSKKTLKPEVARDIELIRPVAKKYEELQDLAINNPKGGTLKDFPDYKNFLIQEIDSVKNIADANKIISRTSYHVDSPRTRSEARKLLLDKLIEIENAKPGQSRAGFDLALQAGYRKKTRLKPGSSKTSTAPPGSFKNLLNNLQKQERRITQVFNDIDTGKISLDEIANEGGITKYLNKPFGYNAPEVFNIAIRKNFPERVSQTKLLNSFPFLTKYKGRNVLANEAETLFEAGRTGGKFSPGTKSGPLKKIFEFADRHIKDHGGDKVRFVDQDTFIYDNKIFSSNPSAVDQRALKKLGLQKAPIIDLVTEGPKRKEFQEIYKAFDKLREYETIERPHPITGKLTPLTKLLQEADYIATGRKEEMAKNIFSRTPFEVDHFGGIGSDPFKNIRIIPRTLNQAAGQFSRKGKSTIKDIDRAQEALGYKFTGDPIKSLNTYIDTEFQRGQDPNYTGRSKKIAGVKTKLIDEAIQEAGGTGTRGGQILTESVPEGIFRETADPRMTKMLEKSMTQVPILEKTSEGKVTMGSRPVTGKEVISVPERDAIAKNLARRLLNLDLGFLPKRVRAPLEFGQEFIKGFGRNRYGIGGTALRALGRGAQLAFTPTGLATLFTPNLDLTEAENRIALATEAAFLPELVKASIGATKGMKNRARQKFIQRLLNFGPFGLSKRFNVPLALKLARVASPIGAATLGLEGLYQAGKYGIKRRKELQEMSPEQIQELRRQSDEFSFGEAAGAAGGGLLKQAGDRSGKPPEAGPTPQGLDFLLKRGR